MVYVQPGNKLKFSLFSESAPAPIFKVERFNSAPLDQNNQSVILQIQLWIRGRGGIRNDKIELEFVAAWIKFQIIFSL